MAGPHYNRIAELKAPDNIILDVKPMQNALMERRKAMEFDINKDQEDQRLAQQASQFQQTHGLQQQQMSMREQEFQQAQRDRHMKMIAGMATVVDEEQDPNKRAAMWSRMRTSQPGFDDALRKNGMDPNDHVSGPKFLLAQAGMYDPGRTAERQSQIRYRDALANEAEDRGRARTMEAQAKSLRTIADAGLLDKPTMTEQEWAVQNQPGGVIYAAFGGRPIPYSQAPVILAQARREVEKSFEPSEEERLAGITREDKMRAYRSRAAAELHGVSNEKLTLKGQRMKPDGSMESIPGAGNTANERQGAIIAKQGLKLLEQGEKTLRETGTFGQLAGDSWKVPGIGVEVGGWGEAGRGFAAVKSAIIDLNFALSGKSVSNAERTAFLDLYMPKSTDSAKTQQFKMQRIRSYFEEVLRMREGGASDDEIGSVYQRAIRDAEKGAQSPDVKTQGRLPGKDERTKRLYDKYGLE